jgi:hypothetical protein
MAEPALESSEEVAAEEAAEQTARLVVIEGGKSAAAGATEAGATEVAGEGFLAGAGVAAAAIAAFFLVLLWPSEIAPEPSMATSSGPAPPPVPVPNPPNATQSCPQSQPQPGGPSGNCTDLQKEIYDAMNELQSRIDELLEDKLDLYHLAYDAPNPSLPPGSGSWLGHLHQADGRQNRVGKLIDQLQANNCTIPAGAWGLATRPLPSQPRGN